MTIETVDQALALAKSFHGDQLYGDRPYVEAHCRPVALMAVRLAEAGIEPGADPTIAGIVGALHDVLEDTQASSIDLKRLGVPAEAVAVVLVLTERFESRSEYIGRCMEGGPYARLVKLADNLCNSDPGSLDALPAASALRLASKYHTDRLDMAFDRAKDRAVAKHTNPFGGRMTPGTDGECD